MTGPPHKQIDPVASLAAAGSSRLRGAIVVDQMACIGGAISIPVLYLAVVPSLWLLALVIPVGGLAVALQVARRAADRGDATQAVVIVAVGNWLVALAVTFVVPFIWSVFLLTVLMPLVLAVPHVARDRFVLMMGASVMVIGGVSLLGLTQMVTGITDDVPTWVANTVVVLALAAVFVTIAVVILQAHSQQDAALQRLVRTNIELSESQDLLADQAAELRTSRSRLASAADQERRRIERDLHDGAQQRLVGLAVRLGVLSSQVDETHTDTIASMRDELNGAIEELRELAHGIYPPLLANEGLGSALRAAARRCPMTTKVVADPVERYSPEVETALYFCGLEAMQNSIKHAGPNTSIEIAIRSLADEVELSVADDGLGFNGAEAEPQGGLLNMRDRIGAVGGTLSVCSRPSGGVEVNARVPSVSMS